MVKINGEELQSLLRKGKSQADCSRHFNVSEAAVSKAVKRLKAAVMPASFETLTDKQRAFVLGLAEGRNATEAAMQAYDCTSRESAKVLGCRMLRDPDVGVAIHDLMASEGIPRRRRIQRLRDIIECPDLSVAGKGLDMSFRLGGDYAPVQAESISLVEIRALISALPVSPQVGVIESEGPPKLSSGEPDQER